MPRGGKQTPLPDSTKENVVGLYRKNVELNVKAVAELAGCSTSSAWNILVANGIEIRGASKWLNEHAHKNRILRRWDAGKSSLAIAGHFTLQREGVARVIAANRPYDHRMRAMLKAVFGKQAETREFLNALPSPRNAGRCAICRTSKNQLFKNYCPENGILRDLLCRRCAQGLGCFNNDAALLVRAAAYLLKHSTIPTTGAARTVPNWISQPGPHASVTWGRALRRSRTHPTTKTSVRNTSSLAPGPA
jgi:hypothetical protein